MRRAGLFALYGVLLAIGLHPASVRAQSNTLTVEDAWARPTPGIVKTAAVYFKVINRGTSSDRLVAASTPAADRAEMHINLHEGDVVRMRRVISIDVPAGGEQVFSPNGFHVMLTGLRQPLKAGDAVPLTLQFDHAGPITVTVNVRPR